MYHEMIERLINQCFLFVECVFRVIVLVMSVSSDNAGARSEIFVQNARPYCVQFRDWLRGHADRHRLGLRRLGQLSQVKLNVP